MAVDQISFSINKGRILMSISEIFCQKRAITKLQRALAAEKVAHAYIFAGPEGVGKLKTAGEWAKLLLCSDRLHQADDYGQSFFESCGQCASCRAFEKQIHPDFNLVYKELLQYTIDGKRKKNPLQFPINVVREFLIDKIAVKPQLSQFTVYVVCEAERLNNSAQNAMLKVVEEPPSYCFLILLCTRPERLLPTILSRCQRITFGPIPEKKIADQLEKLGIKPTEAAFWSRFAEGSLGNAIRWSELNTAGADCYQIKKEMVRRLAKLKLCEVVDTAAALIKTRESISEAWSELERDISKAYVRTRAQKGLIQVAAAVFTDVMKLNTTADATLINSDQREEIGTLAKRFDADQAAERLEQVYKIDRWIEGNVNEKLIFEQLLLNVANSDRISS
jgi:DNA polymerase-3 subunit delta'